METELVRISAKNLGQLALHDYCPKCFWSTIDSYSKKITWQYFEKHKKLPPWFEPFGKFTGLVPVPGWSKFCIVDSETGIRLTGVPDDIFVMADSRYFIADYKTARLTDLQDSLLPMYRVQLNGYAFIFEKLGMGKVGGLGLCYYEPQGDAPTVNFETVLLEDGFVMPFKAHLKRIELDAEGVVRPLLKKVRELGELKEAPKGRVGCGDCEKLGGVVGLL